MTGLCCLYTAFLAVFAIGFGVDWVDDYVFIVLGYYFDICFGVVHVCLLVVCECGGLSVCWLRTSLGVLFILGVLLFLHIRFALCSFAYSCLYAGFTRFGCGMGLRLVIWCVARYWWFGVCWCCLVLIWFVGLLGLVVSFVGGFCSEGGFAFACLLLD